jgi:hypothetical protein
MDEFVCAMCFQMYFAKWCAFTFESDGILHGVCSECADGAPN